MNILKNTVLVLIIAHFILSCTARTFDSQEELLNHINDLENNYSQVKEINGVKFKLTYKPTDLLISQEIKEGESQDKINKLKSHYEKFLYFNLSISKENRELLSAVPCNLHDTFTISCPL